MKTYSIREISELFSLPASTLRYYESEGLLPNVEKSSSGQRIYTEEHIERLNCINCFKRDLKSVQSETIGFIFGNFLNMRRTKLSTLMPSSVFWKTRKNR